MPAWVWRVRRIDTDTHGGWEHTTPAQAAVMALGLSSAS